MVKNDWKVCSSFLFFFAGLTALVLGIKYSNSYGYLAAGMWLVLPITRAMTIEWWVKA